MSRRSVVIGGCPGIRCDRPRRFEYSPEEFPALIELIRDARANVVYRGWVLLKYRFTE